jgi:hypothetical protein
MLPLLTQSSASARPLLNVRQDEHQLVLYLHGLSQGISPDLYQQVSSRLRALYGERFALATESPTNPLVITLYPSSSKARRIS